MGHMSLHHTASAVNHRMTPPEVRCNNPLLLSFIQAANQGMSAKNLPRFAMESIIKY